VTRFYSLFALLGILSAQQTPPAGDTTPAARPLGKWVMSYLHDDNRSTLTLTDLKFPSTERGIASGYITRMAFDPLQGSHVEKEYPVVMVTSNGGKVWTPVEIKELPTSMFFLDDTVGWFVSDKGIWFTAESGRAWRRISQQKNLLRVYFLTRSHGFAVGGQKRVLESVDGGVTWAPVPAAAQPQTKPDWTTYSAIAFDDSNTLGMITGFSIPVHPAPPTPVDSPADSADKKPPPQVPHELIFLGTSDSGKMWDVQTASLFGEITHLTLSSLGYGLGLFEFRDDFPWPSEVHLIHLKTGKSERVFREHDRAITDVLCVPGGECYIAGIEPLGTSRSSPIPGKVKILRSSDFEHWEEIPVDYRAVAHRVWLASPGGSEVWAAADTGMILKLKSD
jgi:hypothetical protein